MLDLREIEITANDLNPTFGDAFEQYLSDAVRRDLSPMTITTYKCMHRHLLSSHLTEMHMRDIRKAHIQALRNSIADEVGIPTSRQCLSLVSTILVRLN